MTRVTIKTENGGGESMTFNSPIIEFMVEENGIATRIYLYRNITLGPPTLVFSTPFVQQKMDIPFQPNGDQVLQKSMEIARLLDVGVNWEGLWVTDKGFLVEVLRNEEAYVLQEDGKRVSNCRISKEGGTDFVGRLVERKRGDEEFSSKGTRWPILRS